MGLLKLIRIVGSLTDDQPMHGDLSGIPPEAFDMVNTVQIPVRRDHGHRDHGHQKGQREEGSHKFQKRGGG